MTTCSVVLDALDLGVFPARARAMPDHVAGSVAAGLGVATHWGHRDAREAGLKACSVSSNIHIMHMDGHSLRDYIILSERAECLYS